MIIFILIVGFVLRLISLNQSFWIDEATSANTARLTFNNILTLFTPGDFHPPFYYFLLKLWSEIFGKGEVGLRMLSVVLGAGTIFLIYLIGRDLFNKNTGLVAAFLLSLSGLHIYYSQEARMYSLEAFLACLAVYFFIKILHEEGRVGDWIGFGVAISLLAVTDYLPILILPVFWIYGILFRQKPDWWKKFFTSHIILFVFAILLFPIFVKQFSEGLLVAQTSPVWWKVLGTASLKDFILIPAKFMVGRISFDTKIMYGAILGIFSLMYSYAVFASRKLGKKMYLFYLWLVVPLAFSFLISFKVPVLSYFRFLFVLPAFYLITAAGISQIPKRFRKIFVVLILLFNGATAFAYLANPKFQREDWRGLVSFIESQRTSRSEVVFPSNSQMEAYRYYSDSPIYGPGGIKSDYQTVWLVRYAQPISDPMDLTRQKVEGLGYKRTNEYDFNGVVVWRYIK